jgi:isocitrate dehydrogenase (NAD+)
MTDTRITVIPGDGIGPDIVTATLAVLEQLDCALVFDHAIAGQTALEQGQDLIPPDTLDLIEKNPATLKGPITTPVGRGFSSVNVSLRQHFELFANVRPALSIPGTVSRYDDVDIITVRENLEGLYSGVGHIRSEDGQRAELRSVITRKGSQRVLRYAFDMARRVGRKKVTVVHKANIMRSTSGLFLEVAREVAPEFPEIQFEEMIVDNCAMQLVMNPNRFDVIVTTNLFGDILSDLCAGLVGGLGLAPGANIGEHKGIFEAVHGSAPDIAGQGIANPTALMLGAAMMLDYLGQPDQARRLRRSIRSVIGAGKTVTRDLGGSASTDEYTQALIDDLS